MQDWAMLRRGDHSAARLQLDREELDWQRANGKSQKEQEFREWIQRPEIRREFLPELSRGISPETLKKIEEEFICYDPKSKISHSHYSQSRMASGVATVERVVDAQQTESSGFGPAVEEQLTRVRFALLAACPNESQSNNRNIRREFCGAMAAETHCNGWMSIWSARLAVPTRKSSG